jgi:hypothetical protein
MRKIIQNFDLIAIPIQAGNTSVYFPIDRLYTDKKINRLFVLSATECSQYITGVEAVPKEFYDYVYVDLFDCDRQIITNNLSTRLLLPECNVDVRINEPLDYSLSEIKIMPNGLLDSSKTYVLLFGFEFQTNIKSAFVEPTNTYLIDIPFVNQQQRYKLADFGTYALSNKRIRRIIASGNTDCFLTLRERSGKVFDQIPLVLLTAFLNSENTYFDFLDIDFDNSFIETTNYNDKLNLTFYYNE